MKKTTTFLPSLDPKFFIKNDASEFDLNHVFNQLTMFTLNPPDIKFMDKDKSPTKVTTLHVPDEA